MRRYIVDGFLMLFTGTVQLSKEQAAPRLSALRALKPEAAPGGGFTRFSEDGCYEVLSQIGFKSGEELGYDGDIPSGASLVTTG